MSGAVEVIAGTVLEGVGVATGQGYIAAAGALIAAHGNYRRARSVQSRQAGALLNITSSEAAIPVVYGAARVGIRVVEPDTGALP